MLMILQKTLFVKERKKSEQIKALNELKEMAQKYGFDISKPATNAKEAVQWLYFCISRSN